MLTVSQGAQTHLHPRRLSKTHTSLWPYSVGLEVKMHVESLQNYLPPI